ncbi:MAG: carboxylating nicotinate-nucleotide diphosphorylase [bacterium]
MLREMTVYHNTPDAPSVCIEKSVALALEEDLAQIGDLTSQSLLDSKVRGRAIIIARQEGVFAGGQVARRVFEKLDPQLSVRLAVSDGDIVKKAERLLTVEGSVVSILSAERTVLNFLQRLCGVATLTARFVGRVEGTGATILDTRKTTPGLRLLEKHAVRMGGGKNHRVGLFDMVLIKENHILAAGGLTNAVRKITDSLSEKEVQVKIEVEVSNPEQVREALRLAIDRVMLDNMSLEQIREAVNIIDGRIETEVSGGVTLETVRHIAETGVDYISVGALTHSAPALDLSLLLTEGNGSE